MIKSFAHKGLENFYTSGNKKGIQAKHEGKLRLQLAALDTAFSVDDMDIPGWRLHPLKGDKSGHHAISVSGNWRLTFRFEDGNAHVVNYKDYH